MSTLCNNRFHRSRETLGYSIVVLMLLGAIPALAQVHGIPPSITSFGSTGVGFMPRPSITSLGPFGWQAPTEPFISSDVIPGEIRPFDRPFGRPFFNGPSDRGNQSGVGPLILSYPYPVPYPVPIAGDIGGAETVDAQNPMTAPSGWSLTPNPGMPIITPYPSPDAVQVVSKPTPAANPQPVLEQQSTVLVFRNGKRLEIRNYAIVGDQVVNLSGRGPRKIALSDLDLNATSRINDDRAVDFRLPTNPDDRKK
jgi:hypothetical protein